MRSQGLVMRGVTVESAPDEVLTIPQICDYCRTRERASCRAVWGFNNTTRTIRCIPCRDKKRKCSFNSESWGIMEWPTIHRSEEGKALRAEAAVARARGKGTKLPIVDLTKSVPESSAPAHSTRTWAQGMAVSTQSTSVFPAPECRERPPATLVPTQASF
jgi:hypothetical protein